MSIIIEDWQIDRIRPYQNNPRVLRNAAEKVAESIREFGWRQPIVVDEDGVVIIGHARLAAATLLKMATAPVHVARGLPDEKVRALRIADNKTSEFAAWDDQKLADELQAIMAGLGNVTMTGFSQSEFDAIAMQAQSELAAIMAQITRPQPVEPAAPHDPAGDSAPDDGDDMPGESGVAEHRTTVADTPPADLVPFNVLMPMEDRGVLFDAIAAAKERHHLGTTAEAVLVIARSYLDAA